ncbi:MAG: UTP--glucose-1-phosphate uridylyltransferase [Spirochaetaceae bacterium]
MKGVILAAGYGTRFLPATKTVPKELLPLVDRPALDLILEEFIASGVTELLLVSSRRKRSLEDYMDHEVELESALRRAGRTDLLDRIAPPALRTTVVRQPAMRGTGHALLLAREFAGSDPVVVAYPDDIHIGDPPLTAQLLDTHRATGATVLATIFDPPHLERYGIVALDGDGEHVTDIVEKPAPGTEPSREASIGRYLYTPDFFEELAEEWKVFEAGAVTGAGTETQTGAGSAAATAGAEFFHTGALKRLMARGRVVRRRISGDRIDVGAPEGYVRAFVWYAARDPELRAAIEDELRR